MAKKRILRDIPQLVERLRHLRTLHYDKLVPQGKMEAVVEAQVGPPSKVTPNVLVRINGEDGSSLFGIKESAHSQFAAKLFKKGGHYYNRCKREAPDLLAQNLNYWFERDASIKRLVRFEDGDIRALLSDRFRIIDNLDVLTTAVQVITGGDGMHGTEKPYARGARVFDWSLTQQHMNMCFVNPSMVMDLSHPERGILPGAFDEQAWIAGDHNWLKPKVDGYDSDGPFVAPSARIRNSETGWGNLLVMGGFYEAICDNTAWVGHDFAQVHLGRTLEVSDIDSPETIKKMNAVVFGKIGDSVRAVFDHAEFVNNIVKFLDLKKITVDSITDAVDSVVKLNGLDEDLRDDILAAYAPVGQIDTLFDVQRAVTNAAHSVREKNPDKALELEEIGGAMVRLGRIAKARSKEEVIA